MVAARTITLPSPPPLTGKESSFPPWMWAMTKAAVDQVLAALYGCEFPLKAVVATTGGGTCASSYLFRPGSSSTLLQFSIPYARESLLAFLQDHSSAKGFCSQEMADRMARAAWHQSQAYLLQATPSTSFLEPFGQGVGVGCTASLATNYEKKGLHQAFISVCRVASSPTIAESTGWLLCRPQVTSYHLHLDKSLGRTREEEDLIVSQWLVYALAQAAEDRNAQLALLTNQLHQDLQEELTGQDDAFVETTNHAKDAFEEPLDVFQRQSQALKKTFVMFLPPCSLASMQMTAVASEQPLVVQDLSFRGVILSGSFNPLHGGHVELALAAQQLFKEASGGRDLPIAFELAVDNADKGVIDKKTIEARVNQFMKDCFGKGAFPVLVSNAGLFIDKARLFPNSVFVIGADTALRIVDPKYYHNDPSEMILLLNEIRSLGCRFVVAGRIDNKVERQFISSSEVLDKVPQVLRELFLPLDEATYRNDISSTEIRARQTAT